MKQPIEHETVYALFSPHWRKQKSEWYVKLGAALLQWERTGKRYDVVDNHGIVWKYARGR
jgi:hypothetical protein